MLEKASFGAPAPVPCLSIKAQVFYSIRELPLFVFKILYGSTVKSWKIKGIIGLILILCWFFLYIGYSFVKSVVQDP